MQNKTNTKYKQSQAHPKTFCLKIGPDQPSSSLSKAHRSTRLFIYSLTISLPTMSSTHPSNDGEEEEEEENEEETKNTDDTSDLVLPE